MPVLSLDALIDALEAEVVVAGLTVAAKTLDLRVHVPSAPIAAPKGDLTAVSIHPDKELQHPTNRHLRLDTIAVAMVTRFTVDHKIQSILDNELRLKKGLAGLYSKDARLVFASTVRGYHPENKGWYLSTITFNTNRRVE